MSHPTAAPVILAAVPSDHDLLSLLEARRSGVVLVPLGASVREWARDVKPDIIILADELPDMTGIAAARLLHGDLRIGHHVPILLLTGDEPTPELRVSALGAGVWDFLQFPSDSDELTLKLATYTQAKRNLDLALADGNGDLNNGLHDRMALARRARELGALMTRTHGALSCIVFTTESPEAAMKVPQVAAQVTRTSDVVGTLSGQMFAILAPGTEQNGAVQLARRINGALFSSFGDDASRVRATVRAGYEAVGNLKYSPVDPVELLARATTAVREGVVEPGMPWLRRYMSTDEQDRVRMARVSPSGGVVV